MDAKAQQKLEDGFLRKELDINKDQLKELKKKLAKIEPRSERGVETLFRLLSKNQYTLNTMIDRKANILISINAIMLSVIISFVLKELNRDPHLIYAIVPLIITNLASITYAVFATRPEHDHGDRQVNNLMFYGNFKDLSMPDYVSKISTLMNQGDVLYETIAKDTYYLGKVMDKKFGLLRKSFNIFLIGIIVSVLAFLLCHLLFEGVITG